MSAHATQPGAGRRSLLSWNRPSAPDKGTASTVVGPKGGPEATGRETGKGIATARTPREPRRPFEYGVDARPERQAGVATFLPTRLSRLALVAGGILVATATTIVLGGWPKAIEALAGFAGPRFARTIAVLRECIDLGGLVLGGWLAQILLVASSMVSLSIRGIRRHRKDGRHGRSRAWLAMAILLLVAGLAGEVPIGRLTGALLSDATGKTIGPDGFGWWVIIAAVTSAIVGLWALLPLHQRLAPGFWLLAGMSGWATAAACGWVGQGREEFLLGGAAAWVAGAAACCIFVLTAARGVIREARGDIKASAVSAPQAERKVAKVETKPVAVKAADPVFEPVDTDSEGAMDGATNEGSDNGYTDGTDGEDDYASRPLSKAEKKRLRKMARMGQAA